MKLLKEKFRQRILKRLRKQNELARERNSDIIKQKLFRLKQYKRAKLIFCYLSFDGEVETLRIVKEALMQGKKIAVPVCDVKNKKILPVMLKSLDKNHLTTGSYGILHPKVLKRVPIKKIDLAIIPGVVFDKKGNRLGRGKGYYDRLLDKLTHCSSIGLAFRFQIVRNFPYLEPHDIPVTKVISN